MGAMTDIRLELRRPKPGEAPLVIVSSEAAGETLLEGLRREGVASLRRGCADGTCGACKVLLDGVLVRSCVTMVSQVAFGALLETFEDLKDEPAAELAVSAFDAERATRCRLCVPALALTAVDLARRGLARDSDAIRERLASAHCQCTGRGSLMRALCTRA
jgi:aerobic carbon-monoxide dehydrogenase small subunit